MKPSILSISYLVILCVPVTCQLRRPRIVSGPPSPLIVNSTGNATLKWKFQLRPSETWAKNIYELSFGIWKFPGFLKTKLVVIDKHGGVSIRSTYERKISCKFNMSRLEVTFTLHNLIKEDEKEYGIHVEFGLSRSPLKHTVLIRLEDPLKESVVTVSDSDDHEFTETPKEPSVPARASEEIISVRTSLVTFGFVILITLIIN